MRIPHHVVSESLASSSVEQFAYPEAIKVVNAGSRNNKQAMNIKSLAGSESNVSAMNVTDAIDKIRRGIPHLNMSRIMKFREVAISMAKDHNWNCICIRAVSQNF